LFIVLGHAAGHWGVVVPVAGQMASDRSLFVVHQLPGRWLFLGLPFAGGVLDNWMAWTIQLFLLLWRYGLAVPLWA